MWTELDDKMLSSIESELLTIIDAAQWELSELSDLKEEDKNDLVAGVKFKYKQISWLRELKERFS